jgi:DNA-binding response OmpR family regulator
VVVKLPILLFDPDPVAADILARQLRHAGFATHVASDGGSATINAGAGQFTSIVVIADLADSQMRHCLHQIRGADPEAWLIVIADPALERGDQVIRELGGDVAMHVPFTISDLARRLSERPSRAGSVPRNTSQPVNSRKETQ